MWGCVISVRLYTDDIAHTRLNKQLCKKIKPEHFSFCPCKLLLGNKKKKKAVPVCSEDIAGRAGTSSLPPRAKVRGGVIYWRCVIPPPPGRCCGGSLYVWPWHCTCTADRRSSGPRRGETRKNQTPAQHFTHQDRAPGRQPFMAALQFGLDWFTRKMNFDDPVWAFQQLEVTSAHLSDKTWTPSWWQTLEIR